MEVLRNMAVPMLVVAAMSLSCDSDVRDITKRVRLAQELSMAAQRGALAMDGNCELMSEYSSLSGEEAALVFDREILLGESNQSFQTAKVTKGFETNGIPNQGLSAVILGKWSGKEVLRFIFDPSREEGWAMLEIGENACWNTSRGVECSHYSELERHDGGVTPIKGDWSEIFGNDGRRLRRIINERAQECPQVNRK